MNFTKKNCISSKYFKFQSSYTLTTPILGDVFSELVLKMNQNVMGVQFSPRGPDGYVLVSDTEKALQDGRLDCAAYSGNYSFLKNSVYELYKTVPFGLSAEAYISYLFEKGGLDRLTQEAEKDNLFVFPMCLLPPQTGGWFQKEIQSLEDFKDIRIRIFGPGRNILEKLGAKTTFLEQSHIIPALNNGLINAVEFSVIEIDADLGLPEKLNYWYTPSWNQLSTTLYFAMNLKKWKSLSNQQQKQIKLLLKENMYSNYISSNAKQIRFLEKYRPQLRTFPDKVLKGLRDSWEEWLDEPGNEFIKTEYQRMKAYALQYSAYNSIMSRNISFAEQGINSHLFEWDYIIVGAGISGAVVLEQLVQKYGRTKNILVLERQDEIGGSLKSYRRDYGETSYTHSDDRRYLEFGGMRYFKEFMPYVEKYRIKYGLTRKDIIMNNGFNLLSTEGKKKLLKDVEFEDRIAEKLKKLLYKRLNIENTTSIEEVVADSRLRERFYNDTLSSKNYASFLVPSEITSTEFTKLDKNFGYAGLIDSDIASSVTLFEFLELSNWQTQQIIEEGYQHMVEKIFSTNGLNTTDTETGKKIDAQTQTNVLQVDGRRLTTDQGDFLGKKIIWTVQPRFLKEIGQRSNMESEILDELENGFVDCAATKIFLFYDKPWWDPNLVGRQLLDNPVGQLWMWDDKTLLLYCLNESAKYWHQSLGIDPKEYYGKYIDIKNEIETTPDWYTTRFLPLIDKIVPTTNRTPLKGYGIAMWTDHINFWKARPSKTYGNILDRVERIRFPWSTRDHVYVANATSSHQGWVNGSIEDVLDVFSQYDI